MTTVSDIRGHEEDTNFHTGQCSDCGAVMRGRSEYLVSLRLYRHTWECPAFDL